MMDIVIKDTHTTKTFGEIYPGEIFIVKDQVHVKCARLDTRVDSHKAYWDNVGNIDYDDTSKEILKEAINKGNYSVNLASGELCFMGNKDEVRIPNMAKLQIEI